MVVTTTQGLMGTSFGYIHNYGYFCKNFTDMFETIRVPKEIDFSDWRVRQRKCAYLVAQQLQPFWNKIDFERLDADPEHYFPILRKIMGERLNSRMLFYCNVDIKLLSASGKARTTYKEALFSLRKEEFYLTPESKSKRGRVFCPFNDIRYDVERNIYDVVMNMDVVEFFLNVIKNNYRNVHIPSICKLDSIIAMNVYEFISRNYNLYKDGKGKPISLENFKKAVNAPQSYDWNDLNFKILQPTIYQFVKNQTLLNFRFTPVLSKVTIARHRPVTHIQFEIFKQVETK
jgi:hypothetical protein